MSYRQHRISALLLVDPKRAAAEMLRAYQDAGCNRAAACRALAQDDVALSEGTWDRWVRDLGIRASLDEMKARAKAEGWHAPFTTGPRPGTPSPLRGKTLKRRKARA